MKDSVFVGLSGGVDSSVAALRLVRAGLRVTGVFIKVWQPPFLRCDWETERLDAMRVAAHLGIPFLTCDAEARYKTDVTDYLVAEYAAGRTPNPDVMCNTHVKFGAFLDFARSHGADAIATGHYARRLDGTAEPELHRGVDGEKDQSYFLWNLSREQLAAARFPVGDSTKSEIRREAERAGLPTAAKPDSQGLCFLGELNMRDFLGHFIPREEGAVLDKIGKRIGVHDGARFYTLGQRHGFTVHASDGCPHYVVAKDIEANTLTVSEEKPMLLAGKTGVLMLAHTNWLTDEPLKEVLVQTRYRQTPARARVERRGAGTAVLMLHEPLETPASGQSCVVYDGQRVLGGGVISSGREWKGSILD